MALTKTVLTGRFPFADDVVPAYAVARFTPSGFDTEGSDVIFPDAVEVELADGYIPAAFSLWTTTAGTRDRVYRVTVIETRADENGGMPREKAIDYPPIAVPAVGPVTIASLLAVELPAYTAPDVLAMAIAAQVAAETAADRAEAVGTFGDRASLALWAASNTPVDQRSYVAGGLHYIGSNGSTVIPDILGMEPVGEWVADHFGLDLTGATNETAALANVPSGSTIDMQGGLITVDAIPADWRGYNGAWQVGASVTSMLQTPPKHALDGQWIVTDRGHGFSYHPGPVWYDAADNAVFRVYGKSMSHDPALGMPVVIERSEDNGQTWKQSANLYAASGWAVTGMSGGVMGAGRYGVILNIQDVAPNRDILFSYSDDSGVTWTTPAAITGLTVDHFVFGEMIAVPTSAGGDDANGFGFFTYVDNQVWLVFTDDNGATWSERLFYDAAALGQVANECCVVRAGSQDKWVGWIRGEAEYKTFVTADLTTLTVTDSGIVDDGPGVVGSPPFAVYDDGLVSLYVRNAENWGITSTRDQQLTYYKQEANSLYANGGIFTNNAQQVAVSGINRIIGMIYHCKTAVGTYAHMRVNESVYAVSGDEAVTSSLASVSLVPRMIDQTAGYIAENLCDNADFHLSQTPALASVTTATMFAERWWTFQSGITFDSIDQVEIDKTISRNFPHRPRYGVRFTAATGNAYAGFEQRYYGKDEILKRADRELTLTVYGTGAMPGDSLRALIYAEYGSSSTVEVTKAFDGVKTYTGGGWSASVTIPTPTAVGKTFGATAKFAIRIDCGASAAAWVDPTFCGVKQELNNRATVILPVNRAADLAACRAHTVYFEKSMGLAYRESSTQAIAPVRFPAMVGTPTVSLIGTAGNLTIDNVSTGVVVTTVSASNITDSGADLLFGHAASTGYTVGRITSSSTGTYIKATVEV